MVRVTQEPAVNHQHAPINKSSVHVGVSQDVGKPASGGGVMRSWLCLNWLCSRMLVSLGAASRDSLLTCEPEGIACEHRRFTDLSLWLDASEVLMGSDPYQAGTNCCITDAEKSLLAFLARTTDGGGPPFQPVAAREFTSSYTL